MANLISSLNKEIETICAVSSPSGEGAISIIRSSGEDSLEILKKIFKPYKSVKFDRLNARTVYTGRLIDPSIDRYVDEVNAIFFKGPQTYTGEDMFEIYPHGGIFNTRYILEIILKLGARLAYNGEFTKRAYINGKINILQAEAILEIIKASSVHNLLIANNQLSGLLVVKINTVKENFLYLLAVVEALIDFAEEEFKDIDEKFFEKSAELINDLSTLLNSYADYAKFGGGLTVVIAGKPNVGKSSLLNAMLQKKRAIVSDTPGTTRDYIEESLFLYNKHIKIIDTAGIRQSNDFIEKEGISLAYDQIKKADLIVYVFDPGENLKDFNLEPFISKQVIFVLNKIDLLSDGEIKRKQEEISGIIQDKTRINSDKTNKTSKSGEEPGLLKPIPISAANNTGIESLKFAVYDKILKIENVSKEDVGITTLRQKTLLEKSLEAVKSGMEKYKNKEPLEIISIDLRDAVGFLDELTGAVSNEDILDTLFKEFCIGK